MRWFTVVVLALAVGACKDSSSPTQPSGTANVVITQTNMCWPGADGYNHDSIWLKNTGNGTAYYVTVGGTAANPQTIAPQGTATVGRVGCNGSLAVSWSNTP